MEFFRIIDLQTSENKIQKQINIKTISEINPEIIVLGGNDDEFQIGCIWGEFNIRRDEIKGGIRFSMLDCPNALTWTITSGYPPEREKITLHLTINRTQKPDEFIEEISEFLDSWEEGLEKRF